MMDGGHMNKAQEFWEGNKKYELLGVAPENRSTSVVKVSEVSMNEVTSQRWHKSGFCRRLFNAL